MQAAQHLATASKRSLLGPRAVVRAALSTLCWLQVVQDLARQGISYNQSLAGSGEGAAGSSGNAGCNDDDR